MANGQTMQYCDPSALRATCSKRERPPQCSIRAVRSHMTATAYFARNTWSFVGGDLDQVTSSVQYHNKGILILRLTQCIVHVCQGLLWHLFYLKRATGSWSCSSMRYQVDHFWGNLNRKPWKTNGHAEHIYLSRLRKTTLNHASICSSKLRRRVTVLKVNISRGSTSPGWAFGRFSVLPGPSIAAVQSIPTFPIGKEAPINHISKG